MNTKTIRHLRAVPSPDPQPGGTIERIEKPTLPELTKLALQSFPPPPWEGRAKNAEHFFEVTAIHKENAAWAPIFAAQQVIRTAFMETLPPETISLISAKDYEQLVRFLDDVFVYTEGLYGLISNKSREQQVTPDPKYVQIPKLSRYEYDSEKKLKALFQPAKLKEISKELSPFTNDLIDGVTKHCIDRSGVIVAEGTEAKRGEYLHENQLRHYLSLLHHFITEMTAASAKK